MTNIKILIVTHKEFPLPQNDIFLPIQVGKKIAAHKMNIQGDDEGDNISEKNPNYGELTALFWAWKNLKTDIIGLYHYRRYFRFKTNFLFSKRIYYSPENQIYGYKINSKKIEDLLAKYDVLMTKPRIYPYSLEIGYRASHVWEDLLIIEEIIKKKHPEYALTWDRVIKFNNKLPHFNMFICNYDIFEKYCIWLFDILFEAEKQIKLSPYKYQQRVFGFLGERLQLLYFTHNKYTIKYLPIYFFKSEGENRTDHSSLSYYFQDKLLNVSFITGTAKNFFRKK